MAESKKNLRNRQEIIFGIAWIGGGFLGTGFVIENLGGSYAAICLVWLVSLLLGFGCVWLITGENYKVGGGPGSA